MKKPAIFLLLFLLISFEIFSQDSVSSEVKSTVVKNGIGLGSVIAAILSWERNKSILFVIISGLLSWLYVIYFAITRKADEKK
ncbi:hypothetical protein GCM10011506_12870 [Marivirga lumbricoides]|uniref:CcmD family protein n=1 Tax=Marivirga lumbricoides TaxID=1046115 RepID=A0ABQ1LTJ9_9BACT|nr:hypothetical protein GCM10011506_12870 [Marivirga lumbricoides]